MKQENRDDRQNLLCIWVHNYVFNAEESYVVSCVWCISVLCCNKMQKCILSDSVRTYIKARHTYFYIAFCISCCCRTICRMNVKEKEVKKMLTHFCLIMFILHLQCLDRLKFSWALIKNFLYFSSTFYFILHSNTTFFHTNSFFTQFWMVIF